ncbi:hypothetical protein [Variovorax sp. OV700]|uniref:hypothetical protein n=1 Tax=Variovorax sp. OV700 TaxID=1882826 RepID=UPI000884F4DA|nr:hypothetical protein [Variovorax sp. OV700]SDJ58450.1 hypothetical protein SAMN05444748_11628 [Variovorax sp. OV700]
MKLPLFLGSALLFACLACPAAELELQGSRLVVSGMLDGSAIKTFTQYLAKGNVRTVVFEDSFGGTADAAGAYADAIRSSGVDTEVRGQCMAACAYAFLAGKTHRFGYGFQVNGVLLPVATRPSAAELASRWRGDEAHKTLAEFTPIAAAAPAKEAEASTGSGSARDNWQPDHGVLFTASPTLFGRIYNAFYCDGSQGRDFSKCERLPDADPYKLGVLTP